MSQLFLGIDVGTTGVKAALFTPEGHLEAVNAIEYPTQHLHPGWVEQNPEDWWQATCTAIRGALAAVSQAAERIVGVAVSSQAPTLLVTDANGTALRPALIWMDRRADAEVEQMSAMLGAENITRITGNRPDAFYVAAKMRWFWQHEPELHAQTRWFLQIPGYINYHLTGEFTLDHAHAALLQLRDYATGAWSAALCAACGVDPSQLPRVLPGHQIQGEVTRAAAELTGLRPGTPVMAGTVDGAAAAVEAGVAEEGTAAEMTGTSTVLLVPNARGVIEPAFIAMPHALPGLHLLLGAMVSSGASVNWFRDNFGHWELLESERLQENVFEIFVREAEGVAAGSEGVLFLPYMMGERSPIWHTNARGVLFGLSLATSRSAVIRAILEGTAFALRHNVEVARQAGVPVREIRSVGGGARNRLWNQIKADVLGIPVLLPETSVGAPFGDAVLVGLGLGIYDDPVIALKQMVRIKTVYEPDRQRQTHYDHLYPIFRNLYEHLREDFDALAEAQ
ncbi:MAG: FGGY-family carbohydrate kinase [Anaerolineae bacterium]|nr:FGGY-family carbohydrate kinase [Anaerolineae bacterium]